MRSNGLAGERFGVGDGVFGGELDVVGEGLAVVVGYFVDLDVSEADAGAFEEVVGVGHGRAVEEAEIGRSCCGAGTR